jgi:acetate kinase
MKILVLNCGSSSIKYQLFEMATHKVMAKGVIEKIGMKGSFLKFTAANGDKVKLDGEILDHQTGIEFILGLLVSEKYGCVLKLEEIDAVGHRVVHGGERFNESVFINEEVVKEIENCITLAPLHNPPNLKGIFAIKQLLPNTPQVAVFDTAFHQTMPGFAYMYAIPYSLYKKYGIRRYGFHGTSHRYVSKRACEMLNLDFNKQRIITCHLGNGASVAAIKHGKSIDTSMGMTPVEGLIMGTRCGDLDAGIITHIMEQENINASTLNTLLNKHSGVLGVTGISSDMRDIEIEAWVNKNETAQLALDMYHYRIRKYIGAYAAAMGGVDLLIFAGGVGEMGSETREEVCKDFEYLGLEFDKKKNDNQRGKEIIISKDNSKVTALVVPTNEELVIANDTMEIVSKMK